jgi:hypothetical protein
MNEITSVEFTQKLCESYYNILKNLDISYLDKKHPARPKELSGIFLSSIPENYHTAKNKIMIIGRETKGWGSFDQKSKNYSFTDLQDFIQKSVMDHQCFFKKQLLNKNTKGRSFHNFTREIAEQCGSHGISYANLFCFSWKRNIPTDCSHFEIIKKYSEKLLKTQIEILNPEIIIFANGVTGKSVEYRREFFPIELCVNQQDYDVSHGIKRHYLWEFNYENHHCFRIHHPSTHGKNIQKVTEARKFLIEKLLPSK